MQAETKVGRSARDAIESFIVVVVVVRRVEVYENRAGLVLRRTRGGPPGPAPRIIYSSVWERCPLPPPQFLSSVSRRYNAPVCRRLLPLL